MENSMNSMKNLMITTASQQPREDSNNNSSNNDDEEFHEESSWTFYIQDFMCETNEHGNPNNSLPSSSCHEISASLLSDAATSVVRNPNYQKDGVLNNVNYVGSKQNNKKKNSSRKRKVLIQGGAMDDDLEDTASSPVNSPKVSFMEEYGTKQKDLRNVYIEEVGRKSSSSREEVGGESGDITELKKRGLCLVPLSNVANYFSY